MKIPKIISKNNHEYIFVKQVNKNMFLYKDMLYGYNECFTKFDLGMIKEIVPASTHVNPENVKI
ncbi:MAG: hypothetical protein OSJ66_07305 [Clostridia bacterium]|nr:hypothetical protein [Clostridia bacterium]